LLTFGPHYLIGTDDWTILACMALLIPLNGFVQLMTNNGLGTDDFTLSPRQITLFLHVRLSFPLWWEEFS
jgi:hypothetical protein